MRHKRWHDLLGEVPDIWIADTYGITRQRVQQVRAALGIPAHGGWRLGIIDRRPEIMHDLGVLSDQEIVQKYSISMDYAARLRRSTGVTLRPQINWDRWDRYIGTVSDQRLADIIGCSHTAVRDRRILLGIQSWSSRRQGR